MTVRAFNPVTQPPSTSTALKILDLARYGAEGWELTLWGRNLAWRYRTSKWGRGLNVWVATDRWSPVEYVDPDHRWPQGRAAMHAALDRLFCPNRPSVVVPNRSATARFEACPCCEHPAVRLTSAGALYEHHARRASSTSKTGYALGPTCVGSGRVLGPINGSGITA